MKFSYSWLQKFFKKDLPTPEKLATLLTKYSFEAEVDGDQLELDILHNRAADCFSYWGLAREIATLTGRKLDVPDFSLPKKKAVPTNKVVSCQVKEKDLVNRYNLQYIEGVSVKKSSSKIQKRLENNGLQTINNIVDVANYVMLELGQPIHAFDLDKISGSKIIIRSAKKGEEIVTLDGEKYVLQKGMLVIADKEGPLAIAGIKGGQRAAITSETDKIVIEAANFDSYSIRQTSRQLGLRTDAEARFENGIDPHLIEKAQNRMAHLIKEVAGGEVSKERIDFYPQPMEEKIIELDLDYVSSLLGVKIPSTKIKEIINNLRFEIISQNQRQWKVKIPTYRLDISIPEDLIEEIGRVYGYEEIEPCFPKASLIPPQLNENRFWQKRTKDFFQQAGYNEIYSFAFIGRDEAENLDLEKEDLIKISNPISQNYEYLSPYLLINLLKVAIENRKQFNKVGIFEIAKVFWEDEGEQKEQWNLATLLTTAGEHSQDFIEIKGLIESLFTQNGIKVWLKEVEAPEKWWQEGQILSIKADEETIGYLGQLNGRLIEKQGYEDSVFAAEINFEKFKELALEDQEYEPISSYPALYRDLSVIVPGDTLIEEVIHEVSRTGGKLLRDVDLIDVYQGENMEGNNKSLTLRLVYQSTEKALNSEEVKKLQKKVFKTIKQKDWRVRQ